MRNCLRMFFGTTIVRDTLSRHLYDEPRAALYEVVRDGCNACMPDDDTWIPARVRVDVLLHEFKVHPKFPYMRCLIVADQGHGYREEDYARTESIGRKKGDRVSLQGGSSEKGIGKVAPFVLNELILNADDDKSLAGEPHAGYHVYTKRADQTGVTHWFLPCEMESGDEVVLRRLTLAECTKELGLGDTVLKEYFSRPSFTIKVIPNSIYKTADEVARALRYYLPRQKDKRLDIRLNGRPLEPFPLSKEAVPVPTKNYGTIVAHLEALDLDKPDQRERAGIMLVDGQTGFPCARLRDVAQYFHFRMADDELGGIIGWDGLLAQQNTNRRGLKSKYLKSPAWKVIVDSIRLRIEPYALDLVNEQDRYNDPKDPLVVTLKEVIEQFHGCWGTPPTDKNGEQDPKPRPPKKPRTEQDEPDKAGPPPDPEPDENDAPPKDRILRHVWIDGLKYYIQRPSNVASTFPLAQVMEGEVTTENTRHRGKIVKINKNSCHPKTKGGLEERMIRGIFEAIARVKFPKYAEAAQREADRLWCQLNKVPFIGT